MVSNIVAVWEQAAPASFTTLQGTVTGARRGVTDEPLHMQGQCGMGEQVRAGVAEVAMTHSKRQLGDTGDTAAVCVLSHPAFK